MKDSPIWDGNGGHLDPSSASTRDMLVALHVKTDEYIIPMLRELDAFRRRQEGGELTVAQKSAVKQVLQDDRDQSVTRRSAKTPIWALGISVVALIPSAALVILALLGSHA